MLTRARVTKPEMTDSAILRRVFNDMQSLGLIELDSNKKPAKWPNSSVTDSGDLKDEDIIATP
jgi:hypothetical protein